MQALLVVVLQIATESKTELLDGLKGSTMDEIAFERVEERLHMGVLVGRPATRHALLDTRGDQPGVKRRAEKLTAPIAVKDQAGPWAAATERCVQQAAGEHSVSRRREPPGQHAPRVLIQHDREVPPLAGDGDIREIADPDLVDAACLGPSHTVRMLVEPPMRSGRASIDARDARAHAVLAHEPLDPSTTDPVAARGQRLMDAWAAVGSATSLEDCTHLSEYDPVLPLVCTHRPLAPRVVPRPRDPEEPTEPHHAERLPFLVDEREDVAFRAEVNRMSFFSKACSSWSSAWARWSA